MVTVGLVTADLCVYQQLTELEEGPRGWTFENIVENNLKLNID